MAGLRKRQREQLAVLNAEFGPHGWHVWATGPHHIYAVRPHSKAEIARTGGSGTTLHAATAADISGQIAALIEALERQAAA